MSRIFKMPNLCFLRFVIYVLAGVAFAGFFVSPKTVLAKTNKACLATFVEPKVTIKVKEIKPRLIRNKSYKQITRIAKNKGSFAPSIDGRVLGLMDFGARTGYGVRAEKQPIGNKEICVRLTSVHVEVVVQHADIFVAKEYKAGTCQFKAILAHENEHVAINNRYQKKFVAAAKKELTRFARRMDPFIVKSSYNVEDDLISRLARVMKPLEEEFYLASRRAHQKIDTPRSYQKVRSRCAKW